MRYQVYAWESLDILIRLAKTMRNVLARVRVPFIYIGRVIISIQYGNI